MIFSSSGGDESLFSAALIFLYISCPLTFLSLQFLSAPYGRHSRAGWGPTIPAPLAWFLMESPALFLPLLLFPRGRHRSHPLALIAVSLYLLHYAHRTLIYPLRLRLRPTKKATVGFPISIAAMAFAFNLLNGYLQSRSASHYAVYGGMGRWDWVRAAVGAGVFGWGMKVNVESDLTLGRLKAEGAGGYRVPRGGWFEMVACPNYMGEAAEWLGWAVMAWSPAAAGFFLYAFSNLGPRARQHRRWYRDKFGEEFPASRKAIIPFVY